MKELLSLVPEIKAEYETVYREKSRALRILKRQQRIHIVDSEIEEYENLATDLNGFFPEIRNIQETKSGILLFAEEIPLMRAVSGEEYLVMPLRRHNQNLFLPEMSVQFLIMYLLGMISRYRPKEWGEVIEGEKSGEIYIIPKFLETITRKFPNLILNKLWNRIFVFVSPQFEEERQLGRDEMEQISRFVNQKMFDALRGFT